MKMKKYILIILFILSFNFSISAKEILLSQSFIRGYLMKYNTEMSDGYRRYICSDTPPISQEDLFENMKDIIEISHIFNSFSPHGDAVAFACDMLDSKKVQLKEYFNKLENDNSLMLVRLIYYHAINEDNSLDVNRYIERLHNLSSFERIREIYSLGRYQFERDKNIEKNKYIVNVLLKVWETSIYLHEHYFVAVFYDEIRQIKHEKCDDIKNKLGVRLRDYRNNLLFYQSFIPYFYFANEIIDKRDDVLETNFLETEISFPRTNLNMIGNFIFEKKFEKAYNELMNLKLRLEADYIFYWFKYKANCNATTIARKHIQNPEFKDARYKTVYYLVNHDFDYSFPILVKMVQDGSLHINEKKNFYRGLARLNKLPYSVLTKKQQQKANDYLKQQMHNEQDMSIKLYIDFLLSICIDGYGLSDERIIFLNSLKKTEAVSNDVLLQIDHRLKIIKYSIYADSPSIFDSYINGLKYKEGEGN